jgi:hypothetical protein
MLRKCTDVTFRYDGKSSQIEAIICEGIPSVEKTRHIIQVDSRVTTYMGGKVSSAFEMLQACQHSPHWVTITKLLRAGDDLTLLWSADAWTTPSMKVAGFHGDTLDLRVERRGKIMTFRIDTSITRSVTGRMCLTEKN